MMNLFIFNYIAHTEILNILGPLLREFEKDPGLTIDNAVEEPGSQIGDNYMSIVVRTRVTGKRGNGDSYEASLMTKRYPRHRPIVDVIRNADLFFNEAHAYSKLLPLFGTIAPRCIYADENDIIMEDLRDRGYVVCERRNLLDLHHCESAIKALASLHARSLTLKLSKPQEFDALIAPLKEAVFPQDDKPAIGHSIDASVAHGIKSLKSIENPDENVHRAIEFLESLEGHSYNILRNLFVGKREKYDVLTHGDAWNNNILFKHDDQGRVIDVKLIDYQIVRHISPAIDFHYFVYSSAKSSVIDENYENLVKFYQNALVREMKNLEADDEVLHHLSLEWFEAELKKTSMYGLLTSLWLVNAVLAEEDETIDMDTVTPDFMEIRTLYERPIRAAQAERVKRVTLHYCHRYR